MAAEKTMAQELREAQEKQREDQAWALLRDNPFFLGRVPAKRARPQSGTRPAKGAVPAEVTR